MVMFGNGLNLGLGLGQRSLNLSACLFVCTVRFSLFVHVHWLDHFSVHSRTEVSGTPISRLPVLAGEVTCHISQCNGELRRAVCLYIFQLLLQPIVTHDM